MTSVPNPDYAQRMRELTREIFLRALSESSIGAAFQRHVQYDRGVLRVVEDLYSLNDFARVLVISIGKAARPMLDALRQQVGDMTQGIVADPNEGEQAPGFRYFC